MPLIDIVIPCYNYGRYLPDCIGSLQDQSEPGWRAIVIDDASPDGSGCAVLQWAEREPRVVPILHARNQGHISTYNEGIALAAAPFVMLLSADDMLAPGALARAVGVMQRHPDVAMTYGPSIDFDGATPLLAQTPEGCRIRPGTALVAELCGTAVDTVPTPSVILRTTAQHAAGPYRASLPHSGDLEMWLRVAMHGSVAAFDAVQSFKRVHGANMSVRAADVIVRDYVQRAAAFASFFEGPGAGLADARRLERLVRRRLAGRAFWTAAAQVGRGRHGTAMALLRLVARLNPTTLLAPPLWPLLRSRA